MLDTNDIMKKLSQFQGIHLSEIDFSAAELNRVAELFTELVDIASGAQKKVPIAKAQELPSGDSVHSRIERLRTENTGEASILELMFSQSPTALNTQITDEEFNDLITGMNQVQKTMRTIMERAFHDSDTPLSCG